MKKIEDIKELFGAWSPPIVEVANLQPYFREYCREWDFSSFEAAKAAGGIESFIVWIGSKWMEWREETKKHGCLTNEDHDAFSAWLPGSVDKRIKVIMGAPELNCHGYGGQMPDDWNGE